MQMRTHDICSAETTEWPGTGSSFSRAAVRVVAQVSKFSYGAISVAVREGALGDGLGAKVWSVCHIMVRCVSLSARTAQQYVWSLCA